MKCSSVTSKASKRQNIKWVYKNKNVHLMEPFCVLLQWRPISNTNLEDRRQAVGFRSETILTRDHRPRRKDSGLSVCRKLELIPGLKPHCGLKYH